MELFQASSQWATRPADQRFATVSDLDAAVRRFRERAVEREIPWSALQVVADAGTLKLQGSAGIPARLTHWAFGQLAQRAGAPAGFLRALPPALARDCLAVTLPERINGDSANLLLSRSNGDDSVTVHALLTERYSRIWDSEVTARLLRLESEGWQVPPARPVGGPDQPGARQATERDCLRNSQVALRGLAIKPGDWIAPAGLYASDHDVFAFMVREDRVIDAGQGRALNRGFFVWNSEVGAASFGIMTFLYDAICGNHIVWGASDVKRVRVRHVGKARATGLGAFVATLTEYSNASAGETEAVIKRARSYVLGPDKAKVLDAIMGKRIAGLTQGTVVKAYDTAERYALQEGDPNTVWGMVNGLTRVSQEQPYAEDRVTVDRAAGKLLEVVF